MCMKKFIKRLKCKHEYQKIDTWTRSYPSYNNGSYITDLYYVLYCPVCDKEKTVNADRYDREIKKEELRSHYNRGS